MDGVPRASAANVVDWSGATKFTFEFFVEAEDGTFAVAMDVACTTAT